MATTRKRSRKRDAILACLRGTAEHPTAEWIYQALKPEIPDLSLATVYRNLAQFKQCGEIESVGVFGGLEHFDWRTDPHAHLVCSCCGAVIDAEGIELPGSLIQKLEDDSGVRVSGCKITFSGLCPVCAQVQNPQN